jgi:hypothetical protein
LLYVLFIDLYKISLKFHFFGPFFPGKISAENGEIFAEIFMEKSFEKSLPIFPGKFRGNFPEKVIFRGKSQP